MSHFYLNVSFSSHFLEGWSSDDGIFVPIRRRATLDIQKRNIFKLNLVCKESLRTKIAMLKKICFPFENLYLIIVSGGEKMSEKLENMVEQMGIGKQITRIRKERNLTQEDFAQMFHVTRQTVSNWENEKSYPDLQTLIVMSDIFEISLDVLIKEDSKMVKTIDKERLYGTVLKREKNINGFFTGSGTGMIISCLFSPDSYMRTIVIIVGVVMLIIGWYKQHKYEHKIIEYFEQVEQE